MKFRSYRFISRASFYLFLAYLLSFVLYYVATFIHPTDVLTYIWLFAERATYLLFPTISAVLTLIVFVYCGAYKGAVAAIPLSLTRLVYLIPYYYLYIIQEGYDSIESLGYGTLLSLGEIIILYGVIMLITVLVGFIIKKRGYEPEVALAKRTVLDFADPVSLSFMLISLFSCVYLTVKEIADTVYFISEYGAKFTPSEIVYMVISYAADVFIPLSYYFILSFIKNRVIASRLDTASANIR
jgi:hypothetical protein